MRTLRWALLGAAALTLTSFGASAQAPYPNQVVRIVVPFSAGSATDLLARAIGDKLSEKWKQQVVDRKPARPRRYDQCSQERRLTATR